MAFDIADALREEGLTSDEVDIIMSAGTEEEYLNYIRMYPMEDRVRVDVDCEHCERPEDRCSDESDRNCWRRNV